MNTRIQELLVELKKTVSTHRGAEVLIGHDEIEKFAELIVQECVNVLHDNELWNRHISHALKEHFGVEQ